MEFSPHIAPQQYRYFFSQLSPQNQTAYNALLDGYLHGKESIRVVVKSADELEKIHHAISYDVPEIFYIKEIKASVTPALGIATIHPSYRFTEQERAAIMIRMEHTVQPLLRQIKLLSDSEKVKRIHDHLIRSVTYQDADAPYSHEAPGSIVYGIGVCEGISKAFKYIADRAGLQSLVAVGDAFESGDTFEPNESSGHAWNIVFIAGQPYHLDITFDQSISRHDIIRYDYYLLSDAQIKVDHVFEGLPRCDVSTEYYEEIGCCARSKKALIKLVAQKLRPGAPLVFKIPLLEGDKQQITDTVINIAVKSVPLPFAFGRNLLTSCNPQRMIFLMALEKMPC